MKQVVIINKGLGMRNGKISRICLSMGTNSSQYAPKEWKDGKKAVVLKATQEEYDSIKNKLKTKNIILIEHVDAGRTQVKAGSSCGICFFCKEGEFDFIEKLKLL